MWKWFIRGQHANMSFAVVLAFFLLNICCFLFYMFFFSMLLSLSRHLQAVNEQQLTWRGKAWLNNFYTIYILILCMTQSVFSVGKKWAYCPKYDTVVHVMLNKHKHKLSYRLVLYFIFIYKYIAPCAWCR